jgi:hypothetical protein
MILSSGDCFLEAEVEKGFCFQINGLGENLCMLSKELQVTDP